jgi:DNA recombination protein RmuC
MDRKMDVLRIEGGKKDIELSMKGEQLSAATSRVTHLEAENKSLHAKAESQSRELELVRQQMGEELKRHEERFKNMAQQLMETSASKLKESNAESMTGITQPLKDASSDMRKAISDNLKDSAERSASFREQREAMVRQTQSLGEKTEGLVNVLRRDNKVSGNMGEIILGDLLTSQGLTEGIHYEVQARLRDENGRPLKHD